MSTLVLMQTAPLARLMPAYGFGGEVMRKSTGELARQLVAAAILSAIAVAAMMAAAGRAGAADLTIYPAERPIVHACPGPQEVVVLYDRHGRPTVPARTP